MHRHLPIAACILALAACGEAARPDTAAPVPKTLEGMPPAVASPASPAAAPALPAAEPATPSQALDVRYAQEHDRWRLALTLELPPLPGGSARRIRHACEVWLFQGFTAPGPEGFAPAAKAAHDRLIAESPVPADTATAPWYDERTVSGTQLGPWLSLARSMHSYGGGAHPNDRIDGLVVEIDSARALMLDEIVPADRQAALRATLAAALRSAKGIPAGQPLTSDIQKDEDLPIPVPLLSKDGARFIWNRFDIASYADGEFSVSLAPEQMRGVLAVDPWKK